MKYCDTCSTAYPTDFNVCPRDNTSLRLSSEIIEGLIIAKKYCVLEKIGAGGMATVYRARHLAFNEIRAIKVVNQRLADEAFLKRFKGEAIITRKLQHPNAVRVDDFDFTEDGRPFIVMEYVQGESLRKILKAQGPLGADRALHIARQVAEALKAAHTLGIIHRDIKPDNVLLTEVSGQKDFVKVLDFGIAKVQEGAFEVHEDFAPTQVGFVVGTPAYIAPEQARGKKYGEIDGRADLYSLGVVLYEMLTGQLPFHSETSMEMILHHLHTPVTPPHKLKPELGIPMPLSRLLLKAMEKEREDRFQSADEMLEALRDPTEWARRQAYSAAGVTPLRVPVAVAAPDDSPMATGIRGSENYEAGRVQVRRGPIYDGPAAARVPAVFARDAALPTLSLGGYAAEQEMESRRPRRWPWVVLLLAAISVLAGYFYAYPASLRADAAVARLAYERAREKYRAWRGRPASPPSPVTTSPPEETKQEQSSPAASTPVATSDSPSAPPASPAIDSAGANSPPAGEPAKNAAPSDTQPPATTTQKPETPAQDSAVKDHAETKAENPAPVAHDAATDEVAKSSAPAAPKPAAKPRTSSAKTKGEFFGVVYEGSQPAAHVTVELDSPGLGFDQSTVTDSDGKYRFTGVPAGGGYVLTAIRNGSAVDTRSGLVVHGEPRSISPPLRMDSQSAQAETVRVYGRVFDASGKPVPAVTVKLENQQLKISRGAVTGADGAYSFTHVPPAQGYQMSIIKNGLVASRTSITVQPARENPEQVVLLYLKPAPQ